MTQLLILRHALTSTYNYVHSLTLQSTLITLSSRRYFVFKFPFNEKLSFRRNVSYERTPEIIHTNLL